MSDTTTQILQCVRLKRRPTSEDIASVVGADVDTLQPALQGTLDAELLAQVKDRFKLTEQGRTELEIRLSAEREAADGERIAALYAEFDTYNAELKQLITDWQLIDGSVPNDHSDPEYDGAIAQRLSELHARFQPLSERIALVVPRLVPYVGRFSRAAELVRDGDHSWIAGPLKDSYHTVWFELHEELIGVAGLSRHAEAAAGRAE